MQGYVKATV